MKKLYSTPELTTHGSIEELTQQTIKRFGSDDGILLNIPTPTGSTNVPIGS